MGAIVWETAPDEDVLGDCVLAFRPASRLWMGFLRLDKAAVSVRERGKQAAAQRARVPVPRRPRTAATASRWLSPEPAANA